MPDVQNNLVIRRNLDAFDHRGGHSGSGSRPRDGPVDTHR